MLLPAVYRICSLQKPAAVAPVHAVVALLVLLTQLFGYTVPGSALVMLVLLALANAAKVVVNAAGLLEGTLPLSTPLDIDNATIDRAFESAKLQVVKHLGTLRKVLRMDDIVLSVRTVAVILVAASADWVLCVPVLAFFWIVATGLCVADTQARDMVDKLCAEAAEPAIAKGVEALREPLAKARETVLSTPPTALAGGVAMLMAIGWFANGFLGISWAVWVLAVAITAEGAVEGLMARAVGHAHDE